MTAYFGWLSVNLVALYAGFESIEISCLITMSSAMLYYKIYLAVRHHTNQIYALQVQQETQNGEMANVARLRKSAIGTFYVYLAFLACYLPNNCIYFAAIISGSSTTVSVSQATLCRWCFLIHR